MGSGPRSGPLPLALPDLSALQWAAELGGPSPCLQSAPATVGISCAHTVPAGGMHLTCCNLHTGHLQTEGSS